MDTIPMQRHGRMKRINPPGGMGWLGRQPVCSGLHCAGSRRALGPVQSYHSKGSSGGCSTWPTSRRRPPGPLDVFALLEISRHRLCIRFLDIGLATNRQGVWAMNPTDFAMRRPVTTLMLVVALISGGLLGLNRMRVDIFPSLNVPKIYVFLDYIGMSPDQMEGFIVNELELYFQYVDGIKDIDTRNIQQVALCELSFFNGTDMGQAMAQVVAMSDRAMSWMPKGTLPPMIMRMDSGSVPVGYLVFESEVTSLGAMGDLAQNIIRPLVQKNVPGTVAISPFGPNMRSIVVNVDPQQAAGLQPDAAAGHRCPGDGEHGHPRGEHLHQGLDAAGRQQRHGGRHPEAGRYPAPAGEERLPPRRGDHPGLRRHHVWIRAGQRQEFGLSADHQERHGIDLDRRGRRPQVDAVVPRRRPQGRHDQLRVRRVAHGGGGGRERGDRGADRRGLDRADDPACSSAT